MITDLRDRTRPGRQAMLWYRHTRDHADRFPVMLANRRGVFTAPSAEHDIPADARVLAYAVHREIARNPRAWLADVIAHHHRRHGGTR